MRAVILETDGQQGRAAPGGAVIEELRRLNPNILPSEAASPGRPNGFGASGDSRSPSPSEFFRLIHLAIDPDDLG